MIDHDLKELDAWSKKWLMSFNPDKTEIMLFSNTDIPKLLSTPYDLILCINTFMPNFVKCFRKITEYKTANFLFF
jgi:hypothetical protein